jgi:hypothetical protein
MSSRTDSSYSGAAHLKTVCKPEVFGFWNMEGTFNLRLIIATI